MHSGFNEPRFGFSMLFAHDLAIKEYFETIPMDVRKKVSAHKFDLGSVEETNNHSEKDFLNF